MPRKAYEACPACGRAKTVPEDIGICASRWTVYKVRGLRCTWRTCRAQSVDGTVIRLPAEGLSWRDDEGAKAVVLAAVRRLADSTRRRAAAMIAKADEMEAWADGEHE